ncbi:MAG: methylated-DNA--[protein]-cysteine S-methyltransferase [Candidatus Fervidibacter sp.]|uniref:methylated-DNA--[protein]-cysteine S-methyltransferase n=1 Tax=Candidatus Fervidibacter sp. TaxID=3100871 RepID=UPI00404A4E44
MGAAIRKVKGWGWVGVGTTSKGVAKVVLPKRSKKEVKAVLSAFVNGKNRRLAEECARLISRYLQGEPVALERVPIDCENLPPTYRSILMTLRRKVGFGRTVTYGELARLCGMPRATRLVGQVMAKNPVPLLVPCHRVIRSDGSSGGFSGGLEQKERLLKLERHQLSAFERRRTHPKVVTQKF